MKNETTEEKKLYTFHIYVTESEREKIDDMIERRRTSKHGKVRKGDMLTEILLALCEKG